MDFKTVFRIADFFEREHERRILECFWEECAFGRNFLPVNEEIQRAFLRNKFERDIAIGRDDVVKRVFPSVARKSEFSRVRLNEDVARRSGEKHLFSAF